MYNVLIVDDDQVTIALLAAQLKNYGDFFTPIYACNGEEAVEILRNQEISLLVTDLIMPGDFDGWALIEHIKKNHPDLPAMVITACEDKDQIKELQKKVRYVFNKPVKVNQLAQAVTNILNEDIASGSLNGVSVGSFLQLLEIEEKTCLLEIIASPNERGFIYINKGKPYDAKYHDFQGHEAACRLIALDNVRFHFNPLPKKRIKQRIKSEVATILMEAMRLKDAVADQKEDVLTSDMAQTVPGQVPQNKPQSGEEKNTHQAEESIFPSARHTIIIIGNEIAGPAALIEIFEEWHKEINILTAHEVQAASNMISEQQVDLIVCDQSLSENQKLDALSQLTYAFPHIPCIAIIQKGALKQAMPSGASYYLERPFFPQQLLKCSEELLEISFSGTMKGVATHSLLQMLESEKKTCTLKVFSKEGTGLLYMQNGTAIGAETGKLKNEEAVCKILSWKNNTVEIRYYNCQRKREIHTQLTALIMKAFHLQDELDYAELNEQDKQKSGLQFKHVFTIDQPIPLDIGAELKMEFNNLDVSLKSMMVGVQQDKFLIVTTPSPFSIVQEALDSGNKMVVKYHHLGKLFVFKTTLLKAIDNPHHLLFLSYPSVIYHHDLRSAKRVAIFIPCTLHLPGSQEYHGAFLDMSSKGGLFQIKAKKNQSLPNIMLDDRIQLRCLLPGFNEEQDVTGLVRNIKKDHSETRIGIEFIKLQDYVQEKIVSYLHSVDSLV